MEKELAKLNKGDEIAVEGIIQGISYSERMGGFGYLRLVDCSFRKIGNARR